MDRIDTIVVIVGTLAFAHFAESLYLSSWVLLRSTPLTAPNLPDTLLPTLMRDVAAFRQSEEHYFATLGQPQAVGRSVPFFDINLYVRDRSNTLPMVDTPTIALPLSLANSGTVAWPSPTLNQKLNTWTPRVTELQHWSKCQVVPHSSPRIVSSASVWLAVLQSLLGIAATLIILVRQVIRISNCRLLTTLFVVAFAIGVTLIQFSHAAQTYVVSGRLSKAAATTLVGAVLNFALLAVFAAYALPGSRIVDTAICVASVKPAVDWSTSLPIVSSALLVLTNVALLFSLLFAAYQLQIKLKCHVIRELYNTMRIYRGIGCMFVSGVMGVFTSIVGLALAAIGGYDIGLCWLVQWIIMSRMLTTSLWHRQYTDSAAHKHKFWKSYAYYCGYLRHGSDNDNIFTACK